MEQPLPSIPPPTEGTNPKIIAQTSSLDSSLDYEIIFLPASGTLQILPYQPHKIPTALWVGYSVFTTFRTPITPIALEQHLTRLIKNGNYLGLEVPFLSTQKMGPEANAALISPLRPSEMSSDQNPFNPETSFSQISQLLQPFQETPHRLRLTLIPNIHHLQDLFSSHPVLLPTHLLLSAQPLQPGLKHPINPFSVKTVPHQRMLSHLKHGSYGEDFYLRREVTASQAFERPGDCPTQDLQRVIYQDVLWTNQAGNLTEASTANIFGIQGTTLITPHPQKDGCLPGIARQFVLESAQSLGIPFQEGAIPENHLNDLEGLFLTNSVSGLTPVHQVNGHILTWPSSALNLFEALKDHYHQRVHGNSA